MPVQLAQIGTVFQVELDHVGNELVERRLGPTTSEDRRRFVDEEAALRAYHARIAELLASRWMRRSPCERVTELATRELLDAVGEGDHDAIDVYNDLLIERGQLVGEYASLRAHETPDARVAHQIAQLEREHGALLFAVFGALPEAARSHFDLVWRHGWIYEITVRWRTPPRDAPSVTLRDALYALLHAPVARFVQRLDLERELASVCVRCVHTEQIRGLRISGPASPEALAAFPGLDELDVQSPIEVGHPAVQTLVLRLVGRIPKLAITGSLPSLRRLAIVMTDPELHSFAPLREWLRVKRMPASVPALEELALWGTRPISGALVEMLVASPLLEQLRVLELAPAPAPIHVERLEGALAATDTQLLLHPMPLKLG